MYVGILKSLNAIPKDKSYSSRSSLSIRQD
jgi:hypothetical protein